MKEKWMIFEGHIAALRSINYALAGAPYALYILAKSCEGVYVPEPAREEMIRAYQSAKKALREAGFLGARDVLEQVNRTLRSFGRGNKQTAVKIAFKQQRSAV